MSLNRPRNQEPVYGRKYASGGRPGWFKKPERLTDWVHYSDQQGFRPGNFDFFHTADLAAIHRQIQMFGYISPRYDLIECEEERTNFALAADESSGFNRHSIDEKHPVDLRTYFEWLDGLPAMYYMPDGTTRWSNKRGSKPKDFYKVEWSGYRLSFELNQADLRFHCFLYRQIVQGGYKLVDQASYKNRSAAHQWVERKKAKYGYQSPQS